MDSYWTTFRPSLDHQNALDGLQQDSICLSPVSDNYMHTFSFEPDALVNSPSSFSEQDSWFFKDPLSDIPAGFHLGRRAQHDDDIITFRSRSDSSLSDWASQGHHAVQPLDPKLQCTYPGCTAGPFKAMCDFKSHLKDHSMEVLRRWEEKQPCRCPWSGNCKSKAVFKSRRILQTHLDNVHITPLLCTVNGCSYRKPFRSNYDLKRHMLTAHTRDDCSQILLCPYSTCERGPKTFVRKDKWLNHIRTIHEGAVADCPINHCKAGRRDGFLTQDDVVKHIRHDHGKFECAIGSCASQAQSRFAEFELLKHLELHHGLPYGDINTARSAVKTATDHKVKPTDISSDWVDCTHCLENSSKKAEVTTQNVPKSISVVDDFRDHTFGSMSWYE